MLNRVVAELRRRTVERFPDDASASELDYVASWVADGRTLTALAHELVCSHSLVMGYLRRKCGADVVASVMREARETGAHVLVEDALDIADAATEENVQVARLRTTTRTWVAERWNARELASKGPSVALQVNVGTLMLEALRQPAIDALPAITSAIAEPADVVSVEPASD